MSRVTILNGHRPVAEGEIEVSDISSRAKVEAAGRAVCKAKRKAFPNPATVQVAEKTGTFGGWRKVAEMVIDG